MPSHSSILTEHVTLLEQAILEVTLFNNLTHPTQIKIKLRQQAFARLVLGGGAASGVTGESKVRTYSSLCITHRILFEEAH